MVGMNITKRPKWLVPGTPVVEFYSNPSSARSIYRRGVIATVSGNEVVIKGGITYQFNVEVRDIGITGLVLQPANGSEVRTARRLNFYSRVGVRFLIAGGRIDQLYDAITE
jgi:hypothetical protein